MNRDKDKMGFSGLSSLVSDVDEAVADQAGPIDQAGKAADRKGKRNPTRRATAPTPDRASQPKSDQKVVSSGASRTSTRNSSGAKWFWALVVGIVVLIGLLNVEQDDEGKSAAVPSYSQPASSPKDAASATSRAQLSDLDFSRPPLGDSNVLSVGQIRWCLREDIRIEVLRPLPMSNSQIDQFNAVVTDYNGRCGSYRYRQGTLTRAQREVERVKARIVASVQPPWLVSTSPDRSAPQGREAPRPADGHN